MMLKHIALTIILIVLASVDPTHAGEWKKQTYRDSIIELWTGWHWTKPERGEYWTIWRDNFSVQTHTASWHKLGETPRIEVSVERLAGGYDHWYGRTEEAIRLDEDNLEWWNYLSDSGVSDIATIQCEARECVTFTAGGLYNCGAFTNWSGQLNDRNDTDLMTGYYCVGQSIPVTAEKLNMIFASIAIRGKAGGYVKRATTDGIIEQQQEEDVDDLSSRAEQGDAEAQYTLGHNYQVGIGVQKDIVEAHRWYVRAAENGHPEAQYVIGLFYEKGRAVGKDLDEALDWYRKAATQANSRAQYKIGLFYEQGWTVPKDLDEALHWYRKAAAQGHALAGMALGRLITAASVGDRAQERNIEDRLTKLKGLYDKGLITKDQYDNKRREILEAF